MAALLKDALAPNLVQTLENNPAFIHGGPFANIAHGCNSVIATKAALKLADYVVTEAGFGADLGAEKFFDIKCRKAGLKPDCAVVVATIRALKMHGGVAKDELKKENLAALEKGFVNLERHVENLRKYEVPVVVSVNRFSSDTEAEIALLKRLCSTMGVECVMADHWAEGGAGAEELARTVVRTIERNRATSDRSIPTTCRSGTRPAPSPRRSTAPRTSPPTRACATASPSSRKKASASSRSASRRRNTASPPTPMPRACRSAHVIPIREVRLSAGAEFVVVICGDIMTMPGLPKVPAANNIELAADGRIAGLF